MSRIIHIASILCLAALLCIQVLPFFEGVGLELHKALVQKKLAVRTETPRTLIFSVEQWSAMTNKKEFKHEGEMFDVKSVKKSGDVIVVSGYYDSWEDEVIKEFKGFMENHKKIDLSAFMAFTFHEDAPRYCFSAPNFNIQLTFIFPRSLCADSDDHCIGLLRPPTV